MSRIVLSAPPPWEKLRRWAHQGTDDQTVALNPHRRFGDASVHFAEQSRGASCKRHLKHLGVVAKVDLIAVDRDASHHIVVAVLWNGTKRSTGSMQAPVAGALSPLGEEDEAPAAFAFSSRLQALAGGEGAERDDTNEQAS